MGEKISGGCACGAIRYETEADPVINLNCHCRDCQRSTGSAYAAVMVVPAAAVTVKGEPCYFRTVGNAGHVVERGFCTSCGSPVTVKLERMPEVLGLHAAGLDDPARYKPTADIFTDSANPWDVMSADTQKMPGGFVK